MGGIGDIVDLHMQAAQGGERAETPLPGRVSGSEAWRKARGESGSESKHDGWEPMVLMPSSCKLPHLLKGNVLSTSGGHDDVNMVKGHKPLKNGETFAVLPAGAHEVRTRDSLRRKSVLQPVIGRVMIVQVAIGVSLDQKPNGLRFEKDAWCVYMCGPLTFTDNPEKTSGDFRSKLEAGEQVCDSATIRQSVLQHEPWL